MDPLDVDLTDVRLNQSSRNPYAPNASNPKIGHGFIAKRHKNSGQLKGKQRLTIKAFKNTQWEMLIGDALLKNFPKALGHATNMLFLHHQGGHEVVLPRFIVVAADKRWYIIVDQEQFLAPSELLSKRDALSVAQWLNKEVRKYGK